MVVLEEEISETLVGAPINVSLTGGEYLGWTGFAGFEAQSSLMTIGHLRWPGGINAEDRQETDGWAYDISTTNLVDNWTTWNGSDRPGLIEMMDFANQSDIGLSIIIPTARYVELAQSDLYQALDWLESDIAVFTHRLSSGEFGDLPALTLEVGAEHYSTNVWEQNGGSTEVRDLFAEVFAHAVTYLSDAEATYGEMYDIAVQSGRFQSKDDPDDGGYRNGEAYDSVHFLGAYDDAGVLDKIDSLIWHRYTERFEQIDDAFRLQIHPDNQMSTLLQDHLDVWEQAVGGNLDLVLSWHGADIDSSGNTNDPNFDHGPRSAHNILQMYSEVVASGADIATIYGIDTQWPGSLSYGTPDDPSIYYPGAVYGLINESVVGLSVTDEYQENTLPVDSENQVLKSDHANFYSFMGEGKFVVFAAAGNLSSSSLTVSLTIPDGFNASHARLTKLSPDGDGAFAGASRENSVPFVFSEDEILFDFFDAFEVARIEFFEDIPPPSSSGTVDVYQSSDGQNLTVIGKSSWEEHVSEAYVDTQVNGASVNEDAYILQDPLEEVPEQIDQSMCDGFWFI